MSKIYRTIGFILAHKLAKRHPIRAFGNFMLWQVQSLLSPSKFHIKPFLSNVRFLARKGLTGITGNIYSGLHEFDDMAFLLHFLRSEDVFLDVGSNVGSYMLLAAGICKTKTTAIEASMDTAAINRKNIELNGLDRTVTLINAAAGGHAGTLNFSKNQDTTNHIVFQGEEAGGETELINIITVDSLQLHPALIKIDVEGFETEVLKGMQATLAEPALKAIIIELNGSGGRYGFDEDQIHQLLLSHKFTPCNYDAFTRSLTMIGSYGSQNTIYCRDIPFIDRRLKTGKYFTIMGEII